MRTPYEQAASALGRGDALAALRAIGLLEDGESLLLKGIAFAQMGDLERARRALDRAVEETSDARVRLRARAALVEIALERGATKEVVKDAATLARALGEAGDAGNEAMQWLVAARAEVLRGRLGEARRTVAAVLDRDCPPTVRGVALLAQAEIAIRERAARRAEALLDELRAALAEHPNELLARAGRALRGALSRPIARAIRGGASREVDPFEIERLSNGDVLLVDTCRRTVTSAQAIVVLAGRPVLFSLVSALARAHPAPAPRSTLVEVAFGAKRQNDSHRARLRVEVGRLRAALRGICDVRARGDGFALETPRPVSVLSPLAEDDEARVALLISDGAAWTARAVSEHLDCSVRTAQRSLAALLETGRARRIGSGRSVTYATAGDVIASRLLLLGLLGAP